LRFFLHGFLAVLAACSWYSIALAQNKAKPEKNHRTMSTYATCYEESTGRLAGSHKARTAVLVSPDEKFRAYAESEAAASTTNDGTVPECQNISKLYVAGAGGQEFHVVLELKPDSETLGNSFDLIDWSSQGHRLLVAQGIWQWGSDAGAMVARIYDADSGALSDYGFVEDAFRRRFGKGCVGVFHPVGFSPEGGTIVRAGPYFDEGEDQPRKESCIAKEGLWMVDAATHAVRLLRASYRFRRYGKRAPSEL
jgi:hypothetical protein